MPRTDTWPLRSARLPFETQGGCLRVGLVARRPLGALSGAHRSPGRGYSGVPEGLGASPCQLSQLLLHHSRSDEKAKKTVPQGHFLLTGHVGWLSGRMGMSVLAPAEPHRFVPVRGARFAQQHETPLALVAPVPEFCEFLLMGGLRTPPAELVGGLHFTRSRSASPRGSTSCPGTPRHAPGSEDSGRHIRCRRPNGGSKSRGRRLSRPHDAPAATTPATRPRRGVMRFVSRALPLAIPRPQPGEAPRDCTCGVPGPRNGRCRRHGRDPIPHWGRSAYRSASRSPFPT
jgi:hypothetical protein